MMICNEATQIVIVGAIAALLTGCAGVTPATQPVSTTTSPAVTETALPPTPSPPPSATALPTETPSPTPPPTATPSPLPSATSASPQTKTTVSGQSEEGAIIAGINQPFQLRINQTATIENEGLRVTFQDVTEDSRCPIGAQCFWEGQATVAVGIAKDGQDLGTLSLTLRAGMEHLATTTLDEYTIQLAAVDPYPKQGRQTQPSDYVVTLVVSPGGA